MSGDGVEQDINKAFNYLEQASQKGSSLAQFFLGEYMNMEESQSKIILKLKNTMSYLLKGGVYLPEIDWDKCT